MSFRFSAGSRMLLFVVAATLSLSLQAHQRDHKHDMPSAGAAGLGSLNFPTSADTVEAQAAFERAALLLHLFEYDDAAKAFQKAQSLEADFVMAVWGEAMTHNHPLWNQLDEAAGRKALQKLGATAGERPQGKNATRDRLSGCG